MFKFLNFFKNKRYYYNTWTGDVLSKEILVYGEIYKVKVYPNEIRRRRGWLDVEERYMEYFIKQEDSEKGWRVLAPDCSTALLLLIQRLTTEEGTYIA